MVVLSSFVTDKMTSIFSHCSGSLPDFFKVSVLPDHEAESDEVLDIVILCVETETWRLI